MQVRNWGAENRLATSANDIQSTFDIVYSSVRDSVRGNAHALSAHKNDRARIAGWGKEGARGGECFPEALKTAHGSLGSSRW